MSPENERNEAVPRIACPDQVYFEGWSVNRVWLNVSKSRDDESCLAIVWSRCVQVAFHSQLRQKRSGSTASRHATKPNAPPISITRGGIGFLEGGDVHTGGRGRERYTVDGNRESGGQFFFYYYLLRIPERRRNFLPFFQDICPAFLSKEIFRHSFYVFSRFFFKGEMYVQCLCRLLFCVWNWFSFFEWKSTYQFDLSCQFLLSSLQLGPSSKII